MNSTIPDGWTVESLASIASVNWGDTSLTKASYVTRGYPAYSASGFDGYLPDFQFDQDGMVLSAIGARCGRVFYATGKWTAIKNTITLFEKPGKSSTRFLYQYFGKPDAWDISGGAQPFIGLTNARKLDVLTPPLPEQQKIASILSSVDDVIEKTRAQIDKLKDLKTGMMQELLTKGIGHTEFKNSPVGRIPKEWNVSIQGEVATFFNGRAYKLSEWEREGTPVIRLQNLTGSGTDFYYSTMQLPAKQYCEKGDLLYMWSATFGPHIWHGPKAIFHYHIWKVVADETNITKTYLYYLLEFKTRQWKEQSTNGMGILHVTKGAMEGMELALPPLAEQHRIAQILDSVDSKLDALIRKLSLVSNTKKALMQDLLTGKVRVKIDQKESAVA